MSGRIRHRGQRRPIFRDARDPSINVHTSLAWMVSGIGNHWLSLTSWPTLASTTQTYVVDFEQDGSGPFVLLRS